MTDTQKRLLAYLGLGFLAYFLVSFTSNLSDGSIPIDRADFWIVKVFLPPLGFLSVALTMLLKSMVDPIPVAPAAPPPPPVVNVAPAVVDLGPLTEAMTNLAGKPVNLVVTHIGAPNPSELASEPPDNVVPFRTPTEYQPPEPHAP